VREESRRRMSQPEVTRRMRLSGERSRDRTPKQVWSIRYFWVGCASVKYSLVFANSTGFLYRPGQHHSIIRPTIHHLPPLPQRMHLPSMPGHPLVRYSTYPTIQTSRPTPRNIPITCRTNTKHRLILPWYLPLRPLLLRPELHMFVAASRKLIVASPSDAVDFGAVYWPAMEDNARFPGVDGVGVFVVVAAGEEEFAVGREF
jgi:hypothetical protein